MASLILALTYTVALSLTGPENSITIVPSTTPLTLDLQHALRGVQGVQGEAGVAGPGVPDGGTTGQTLTKVSNADQDTEWRDAASAGVTQRTAIANGNLSGHRAVYINASGASYASADSPTLARACVGITTGAAMSGDLITITTFGAIAEPSWAWSPGPVYLGLNGLLSQALPTSGSIVEVGIAVSATELEVRVQPPINLA